MEKEKFTTGDINLSAFLDLKGIPPILEIQSGKVNFVFPVTDQLYHLLEKYNKNGAVLVLDFVTRLKMLRGKMLTLKEANGYGGFKNGNGYGAHR